VRIDLDRARFRASGKTISFPGFLRAYVEGSDDPELELADQEKILPKLITGDVLDTKSLKAVDHATQPPARFTEGSLIKELERLGIGRPSTWATIVDVVLSRTYAFKKGTALVPTFLAMAITGLMEKYFNNVIDYDFTARLEEDLDAISRGEAEYVKYLRSFYFEDTPGLKELVSQGETTIDPREVCGIPLTKEGDDEFVEVRIGRYGPFITNGTTRAGLPTEYPPDELSVAKAKELLLQSEKGPESLGAHPDSGKPVYVKAGRFGPYVQEGDVADGEPKPKMASLLQGMKPEDVTMDIALQLLSLPRSLGAHPETKTEIVASQGRYGPYIKHGTENRTIPDTLNVLTITLDEAVELLKQPKMRQSRKASTAKEIGVHPVSGAKLFIKSGRYGPYVTDGKINATIPKDLPPEELVLDEAVSLIDARAEKLGK
jgi:DNA topoisomerase I